jgi:hypothetical protein
MSFDAAAVQDLFDKVQSHAMTLGLFDTVNTHEPKSAPGNGLWCAIWVQEISGMGSISGLNATSGRVILNVRVGKSFITSPEDGIDPDILTAVSTLMGDYSGAFTLGGSVRNIDLLGQAGQSLSAQAGYLTIDQKLYRVMEIVLPVLINELWTQNA